MLDLIMGGISMVTPAGLGRTWLAIPRESPRILFSSWSLLPRQMLPLSNCSQTSWGFLRTLRRNCPPHMPEYSLGDMQALYSCESVVHWLQPFSFKQLAQHGELRPWLSRVLASLLLLTLSVSTLITMQSLDCMLLAQLSVMETKCGDAGTWLFKTASMQYTAKHTARARTLRK